MMVGWHKGIKYNTKCPSINVFLQNGDVVKSAVLQVMGLPPNLLILWFVWHFVFRFLFCAWKVYKSMLE